jgi:hypothetical protein
MSMSGLAITSRASFTTFAPNRPTTMLGARGVEVGDHRDLDAAAGAALDLFLVALQDVEGAAADGADAEQADLDRSQGLGISSCAEQVAAHAHGIRKE